MATDPEIIDIPDDITSGDTAQDGVAGNDTPVLAIERGGEPTRPLYIKPRRHWWILVAAIAVVVAAAAIGGALWLKRDPGLPETLSQDEVIQILDTPYAPTACGIAPVRDTILDVVLDIYPLDGLKASLETELPDTADRTLVAFFRSADYTPDLKVMGPVVMDGEQLDYQGHRERKAYVAISPEGRLELGVGNGRSVQRHVKKTGGSYFRQYVLVAGNTLPDRFSLHGKVERSALGRMADGSIHFVMTRGKETMWGFADALREYGFMDAVYITGGNHYDFIRRPDGTVTMGDALRRKYASGSEERPAPLLVLRRAK